MALSPDTATAYNREWAAFVEWCVGSSVEHGPPTDPTTVAIYLGALADPASPSPPAMSSLRRVRAAIDRQHTDVGLAPPSKSQIVRATWYSILESRGVRPARTGRFVADAAVAAEVIAMIESIDSATLVGQRDRALLVLGAGAALTPAELSRVSVDDLDLDDGELTFQLYGGDDTVALEAGPRLDPARLVCDWVASAGLEDGPLFRSVDRHGNVSEDALTAMSVGRLIRRAGAQAGLSPVPGPSILRWRLDDGVKSS